MNLSSPSDNIEIFTDSLLQFADNLSVNTIIMSIMVLFMIIGAIDRIRGNKLGYGEEFEKGFELIGPLALVVAAVIAVAPMLAKLIFLIFGPFFSLVGIDVSTLPAVVLGPDMGGYYLALELAENEAIGNFSGLVISSVLGPTISFTIPLAFSVVAAKDYSIISAGFLVGLITVPLGCIIGGLAMNTVGYSISMKAILINSIPVIIITVFIIIGIWAFPLKLIKWFAAIGKGVSVVIAVLLAIAIFQQLTGIMFPYFYTMSVPDETTGLTGLDSGLLISGQIGIVLAGALPLLLWISRRFKNGIKRVGNALKVDERATTAFIISLANVIPAINAFGKMGSKGKLLNIAFIVAGGAVLGDFIGFTASVNQDMIMPMLIGKLVSGISALILANILAARLLPMLEERLEHVR